MTIKEVIKQLHDDKIQFGAQIKITKLSEKHFGRKAGTVCNESDLVGQTGTLTNPFVGFQVEGIGVFLNSEAEECCNLSLEDEVQILG